MIITIVRKPFKGSLIDNVKETQCGGINITDTRIGSEVRSFTPRLTKNRNLNDDGWSKIGTNHAPTRVVGRWPANLILSHLDGCEYVGHSKTKGKEGGYSYTEKTYQVDGFVSTCKPKAPSNYGGEVVEAWECVEGCPVTRLDEQSGVLKSGEMKGEFGGFGYHGIYGKAGKVQHPYYADIGGASRFFKKVKE